VHRRVLREDVKFADPRVPKADFVVVNRVMCNGKCPMSTSTVNRSDLFASGFIPDDKVLALEAVQDQFGGRILCEPASFYICTRRGSNLML